MNQDKCKNEIYVISCAYKANRFAKNCIESVFAQTRKVKKHIYIDDLSDDEGLTSKTATNIVKQHNIDNVDIVINDQRKFRLKNIYDAIQTIDNPEAIVMLLDGDDWFSTKDVVKIIDDTYSNHPHMEYIYTNWMYSHNMQLGISRNIPGNSFDPYKGEWVTSAMATFKVKTFKSIPESNFKDWDGDWIKMGTDQAYILPILHMLKTRDDGYSSVGFINAPLYVYQFLENTGRPRSDSFGEYYRNLAHKTSVFLRDRGFLSE